jgi:exopolysaccharide biosynthesis predicted pyruvyltransferase EpsI
MKILNPYGISAEIFKLVHEAKCTVFIVSPYNKIIGWDRLIKVIKEAQSRGVKISWYCRKDAEECQSKDIKNILKIDTIKKDCLHAKIYMNEFQAVITSMNLCKFSDSNSIDIGYLTESASEYKAVYDFFESYIAVNTKKIKSIKEILGND